MKKTVFLLFIVPGLLLSSCFAPLNSVYDNAKLLKKGDIATGISYSRYYGNTLEPDEDFDLHFENLNNNFGLSLGYGLSDKINLNCRYESFNLKWNSKFFDDPVPGNLDYFEIGCKVKLKEDKMALAVPVGFYIFEGESVTVIDPMLLLTVSKNNKFEVNLIPKMHIFFLDKFSMAPGVSFNVGLSNNLDKWAVRPEIGYDGFFDFGIGLNVYFRKKQ